MDLLSAGERAEFIALTDAMHDTFDQKVITWRRFKENANRYNEDSAPSYHDVPLSVQLNSNFKRSWPITRMTDTGEFDLQSTQVIMNKSYLKLAGYINSAGALDFDAGRDLFVIDGITYKCFGDTAASQFGDTDILYTIILQREQKQTGE